MHVHRTVADSPLNNSRSNVSLKDLHSLCLSCGICCNGVLFKDVELQPGDDPAALRGRGLPVKKSGAKCKFSQPCQALHGCRCQVYSNRPQHCRDFECALYKLVRRGETSLPEAQRIVRVALDRARRVRRLLEQLGDTDVHRALSVRFRRTSRRLETAGFDDDQAELFGELSLAVHDLNVLLHDAFYPGAEVDQPSRLASSATT